MGSDLGSVTSDPFRLRSAATVSVDDVSRRFGTIQALSHVSLNVAPGEVLAVTVRSGSGKSTLLNLIGGLDHPDGGRIRIDGEPVCQDERNSPTRKPAERSTTPTNHSTLTSSEASRHPH